MDEVDPPPSEGDIAIQFGPAGSRDAVSMDGQGLDVAAVSQSQH